MYHLLSREFLENEYPILTTNAQAIVNFVSCDGVMGYKLGLRLKALYPQMHRSYLNSCLYKKNFEKGKLLIWSKSAPWVINIPVKNTWKEDDDFEFLDQGMKKLESACEQLNITSLAIQKNYTNDEWLNHCIEKYNLPTIQFYEENAL